MEIDDNDFKQLIGLLQQLVSNQATSQKNNTLKHDIDTQEDESENQDIVEQQPTNVIKNKKSKSVVKKTFVNKFLNMKEASMHLTDAEIDKKLNKYPPTQRNREYAPIEVKCRVCGKSEQIPPSLVESKDRYKCNNCSTSQG